jgi:hypothetical protein
MNMSEYIHQLKSPGQVDLLFCDESQQIVFVAKLLILRHIHIESEWQCEFITINDELDLTFLCIFKICDVFMSTSVPYFFNLASFELNSYKR